MIKISAAKIAATVVLIGGLISASVLDRNDSADSTAVKPKTAPEARFSVSWQRGEVRLSGHTASISHEQTLRKTVASNYPGARLSADFQPLGIVPDFWSETTVLASAILGKAETGLVKVSAESLEVRGIVHDASAWNEHFDTIKQSLPDGIVVSSETTKVDSSADDSALCEQAFSSFDIESITFEESSIIFRHSAYPQLDRLTAFARACPSADILITGHTDATGPDSWNQQLSLNRASSVADYIAVRGIDHARLIVSGAGSTQPIADNATRYGRSKNRRIEVGFRTTRALSGP